MWAGKRLDEVRPDGAMMCDIAPTASVRSVRIQLVVREPATRDRGREPHQQPS
jgi:hypothetical protein